MRKLLVILGVPLDDLTLDEALAQIAGFIAQSRKDGRLRQIATVNADFVVKSFSDPELQEILQRADMLTADGMPLVWGARLLGVPLQNRVTGADLVPMLAERAAQEGWSLYLLGARPGVAARAGEILQARYPGLRIVGCYSPPLSSILEMDSAIAEQINQAKADIVLVAFGNPKQEKWINMNRHLLHCGVAVGVGGTFDFIAGEVKRAPLWMQRNGLEWAYRFWQEPRRLWRRYVVDLVGFGSFFIWQWWRDRRGLRSATLLPETEAVLVDGVIIVSLRGRLDLLARARFLELSEQWLAEASAASRVPNVIINMAETEFIDSAGLGALVHLTKCVREQGGDIQLVAVPRIVQQSLLSARLDRLFGSVLVDKEQGIERALEALKKRSDAAPVRKKGQWTLITVGPRIDVGHTAELKELLEQGGQEPSHVVLDLGATEYLDSAGLALLISTDKKLRAQQGSLRLVNPQGAVSRVIKLSRLENFFNIYPTVEQAMPGNPSDAQILAQRRSDQSAIT